MSRHTVTGYQRREVLASAGTLGLLTIAGISISACESTPSSKQRFDQTVTLPAHIAPATAKPDLPGDSAKGVPDGYLTYPATPPRVSREVPASGGEISAFVQVPGALPPTMDRNRFWQELNRRVGATMLVTLSPVAQYAAKLATLIASDDLPDMIQMSVMRDLPNLLRAKFVDLTEHLSGDAVKQYPNLAALPTTAWRNTVFDGGIFGIPFPLGLAGNILFKREDILDEIGVTDEITSGEEFITVCTEVTRSRSNRWALGAPLTLLNVFLAEMFDAPNVWRIESDRFTHAYESVEFAAALAQCTRMWKAGLFHPDAMANPNIKTNFGSGTIVFNVDSYAAWPGYLRDFTPSNPNLRLGAVAPPKWEGGGAAAKFLHSGMFTFTALTKTEPARVKELLKVLDWFAAPFGSEEYLFRKYGIAGHNYTLNGTDPVYTATGATETLVPTSYIANPAPFLYQPGNADGTRAEHEFQRQILQTAKPSTTAGLYSSTQVSRGAGLTKNVNTALQDIISGRKPLSAWAEVVQQWRADGGDAMRGEYEASLETQPS